MRWPERVRSFSIHDHLEHLQQSKHFTKLWSLLLFSATYSPSMSSMLASLRDLKLLKVLDLSGAALKIFPNEVVKLGHLTYLSINKTEVKKIPKSIGRLKNLQILDLRHTYVIELPDEILNLQRLCHLLAFQNEDKLNCYSFNNECGFKAPVEIGNLTSLQKLCRIEATHGSGICTKKDREANPAEVVRHYKDAGPLRYLQGLPNLVYLDLVESYEEEELCFQADGFRKLKILLLSGLEGLGWVIVEEGAMPRLEELYIQNCKFMEELPSCIEQLTNLTLLDLFDMSDIMVSNFQVE
ncbi:hypothetical protein TEA_007266 [Camellia sinensis var. sinensis]|uniref:Disease resistance R13L4/SHOC-2-like LRR domain-containing protein n=1 Tax=Camellia sinensis var. sinensis TaxID=542762 RepID=A0A4S4ETF2_CAMSN|nr:hypothetical protein TEA_007266 [Camellia sinensis var. sinensis]